MYQNVLLLFLLTPKNRGVTTWYLVRLLYFFSVQYFIFWTPTSRSVGTRVIFIVDCDYFSFLHLYFDYVLLWPELRLVVVYVCYYTYLRSLGVPGGSACSTYMYIWFDFSLVGLYANMAEMSGVHQIDGSCPFFCRIWKIIFYYKTCFNK